MKWTDEERAEYMRQKGRIEEMLREGNRQLIEYCRQIDKREEEARQRRMAELRPESK